MDDILYDNAEAFAALVEMTRRLERQESIEQQRLKLKRIEQFARIRVRTLFDEALWHGLS